MKIQDCEGIIKAGHRYAELKVHIPNLYKIIREAIDSDGIDSMADFTCFYCQSVLKCDWSFDFYNTYGDCLADK